MPEMTSQTLPTSNIATTEGYRSGYGYSVVLIHTSIFTFIAIFGVCLQLKYPNVSPYETPYGAVMMNLLVTEICFYIGCLILMAIQAAGDNRDMERLMNKIGLFLGTLSLILELLVLISPLGWVLVALWVIFLVCFLCNSCRSMGALYRSLASHFVRDFVELKRKLVALKHLWMMGGKDEAANGGTNISNAAEHVIPMPDS